LMLKMALDPVLVAAGTLDLTVPQLSP